MKPRNLLSSTGGLVLLGLCLLSVASADPRGRGRNRGRAGSLFEAPKEDAAKEKELSADEQRENSREERLLNIFQVVRFPNDACNTTAGDSGVCYTAQECLNRGGSQSGSCASGFGVCCAFQIGCGGTTSQNNTYFVSGDQDTSPCTARICKINDGICQIRLDFDGFNIDQPATTTFSDTVTPNDRTQCQNARFIAASDGHTVPVICGSNQGYHMILEARDGCNDLTFEWNTSGHRSWNIKASQIACNYRYKPPEGCLQYFTGTTGTVSSYNYGSGIHLANQMYHICIRTELNMCEIQWVHEAGISFMLDKDVALGNVVPESMAPLPALPASANYHGFYGAPCFSDYVIIPGGRGNARNDNADRYCGHELIYIDTRPGTPVVANTAGDMRVKSKRNPFVLSFVTDGGETPMFDAASKGFSLMWEQTSDCTA